MVRRTLEHKLALARSSAGGRRFLSRLVRVACVDPWLKRDKNTTKSECDWAKFQPSIIYKTSKFWWACFWDPMSLPFCTSLFFVYVDVQQQVGQAAAQGRKRKAVIRGISGVDHGGVLSAPIWLTGRRHCISSRDAIIVVGSVLEKHLDGDITQGQEQEITFKYWPPGYQSWKLILALNGLSVKQSWKPARGFSQYAYFSWRKRHGSALSQRKPARFAFEVLNTVLVGKHLSPDLLLASA